MYIKNQKISLIYKIILVVLCGYGLFLNLWTAQNGFNFKALRYYTIISNLICFVYYIGVSSIIIAGKNILAPAKYTIKGAVVMCITVTLLIYQILLAETPFSMNTSSVPLSNLLVHMIVPIMVILDWCLFDSKGNFKKLDPILWLITPFVYYIFVLIGAQAGFTFGKTKISRFPYLFIDSDKLGTAVVARNVIVIAIAFLALGYIFYAIDWALGRRQKNKVSVT